jgi:hypothetical protein
MKKIIFSLLLSVVALTGYSQIDAQRPTITESYSIIDKGLLQFENGIDFSGKDSTLTYGSFVRGSITDKFELRSYISDADNVTVGAKALLLTPETNSLGLGASFVYNLNINGGSDFRLAMTKNFSNNTFITYNFGYDGAKYNVLLYGVPVIKSVNYFIEYMNYGLDADGSFNRLHSGFTYIPHNDVQLDVSGGVIDSFDNWYVGAGLSFRIGNGKETTK